MTTRAIAETCQALDGAEVSPRLISKVTAAVWETVQAWQPRPWEARYPLVDREGIVVKIRQDHRVITQSVPGALGVHLDGHQAVLGLWLAETEGAKFWLAVLTERQHRGLQDSFMVCVEGLTGCPEAMQTVYPKAQVPRGMVPLRRNALH